MTPKLTVSILSAFALVALSACSSTHKHDEAAVAKAAPTLTKATATIEPKSGSKVKGTVDFEELGSALKITYKIEGLKKNSTMGFHIHEKGDCSSKDAKSAGSHYAKIAETGGTSLETPAKFAGDLPSLKSDAHGVAEGTIEVPMLSINGEYGVKDRAVMVHGGPDNAKKHSAPRVGCGVIKAIE